MRRERVRDHTDGNIRRHTDEPNNGAAQQKQITKHRRRRSAVLSLV